MIIVSPVQLMFFLPVIYGTLAAAQKFQAWFPYYSGVLDDELRGTGGEGYNDCSSNYTAYTKNPGGHCYEGTPDFRIPIVMVNILTRASLRLPVRRTTTQYTIKLCQRASVSGLDADASDASRSISCRDVSAVIAQAYASVCVSRRCASCICKPTPGI